MRHALIFVDNLRIGGFQRLALDEAYWLSDNRFRVTIICLENPKVNQDLKYLSEIEAHLVRDKNISLIYSSKDFVPLFKFFFSLMKKYSEAPLVICHSLRSTLVLKILKSFRVTQKYTINTKIHQIPSLTDSKQRFKRFVYAQFADNLFGFSTAVSLTWTHQFGDSISGLIKLTKRIGLLRNGIYIDRLPKLADDSTVNIVRPRLIFLGRITFWKGLNMIESLASSDSLKDFDFLLIVPGFIESDLANLRETLGDRLHLIVGKSINDLKFNQGDVHLYPANYGKNAKLIEGVSLNCLEMACIGIPSVITSNGQSTWSEPAFDQIFFPVKWENLDSVTAQIRIASNTKLKAEEIKIIEGFVDIENEIRKLLQVSFN